MEQLEASKIAMDLSRKDVQEKRNQLREYTFLLKEEKRKEASAKSHLETKEATQRARTFKGITYY
jgi:hypothetical protein